MSLYEVFESFFVNLVGSSNFVLNYKTYEFLNIDFAYIFSIVILICLFGFIAFLGYKIVRLFL